eukprot:NODE_484_length_1618_cov_298.507330_g368_i0.p1 GENE.NODE_484_length_1618_cov_298.507330_g368_i0~~NODE_484_length_1618_cov_298.507330_g368_i0.p1  ORF type:complete len:488 (-),score=122.45 NODE_484_length_1618_cov_298.507330_g368_i0:154-1557(-)
MAKGRKNTKAAEGQPTLTPEGYTTHLYASEDHFIKGLYKPHTISVGVLAMGLSVYFAFTRNTQDEGSNIKCGIAVALCAFLTFCAVHLPDGLMIRPHPALWRIILGMGVVYMVFLFFLTFQRLDTVHRMLGFVDPVLGVPLPEKDYAGDCRIFTPENPDSQYANIWATINDEFILAHILGHWAKAILLRSWRLGVILSVLFELVEITFQHNLPNYLECWWDHIFIDILICNGLGLWLGLATCKYLKAKEYHWVELKKIKTYSGKATRLVQQFSPIGWTPYEWGIFTSFKSFCQCVIPVLMFNVVDNNVFFLKFMLWIPPPHTINLVRLAIWFAISIPGLREFYQLIRDKKCRRLGANAWIAAGCALLELVLIFRWKWESGAFSEPMPSYIFYPHVATVILWSLWAALYFPTAGLRQSADHFLLNLHLEVLFYLCFVPWTFMFFAGCPDLQWGRTWFEELIVSLGLPP